MYKLIGDNNYLTPEVTVLKNRGINEEDIEWFLNPTEFEYSPELIKNLVEGVNLFLKHLEKNSRIHIQVDKDMDGATSFALLYNYTKEAFPDANITWSNHEEDKKHGINLELVPEDTELLIVPDAGSNEFELHKILKDKGVDVLVIDHHEADGYSEHALVVNPHLDDYPNKQLSGVGVVMKFVQYVDFVMDTNYHEKYYDLVAFGMVGDSMQMSSKETYWMVQKGLKNIQNEFLQEIVKENAKFTGLKIADLSFKCNPKINSLIRVGTQDQLHEMAKAFIGHQEITINNRLRSADKTETWARRVARTCNNTYSKQRKIRDGIWEEIKDDVEKSVGENKFITVSLADDFNLNMSGYLASYIVGKFNKPTLIVRNQDGLLTGSMRGYDPFMDNTKDFLNSLGVFEMAEGHGQAAGIKIKPENFTSLDNTINFALKGVDIDERIVVDFELEDKDIHSGLAKSMVAVSHLWGKGIDEPKFAVKDFVINTENLRAQGAAGNVIKYFNKGVEYITFSAPAHMKELLNKKNMVICDLVGRLGLNTYQGRESYQFVIDEIKIKEEKEANVIDFLF